MGYPLVLLTVGNWEALVSFLREWSCKNVKLQVMFLFFNTFLVAGTLFHSCIMLFKTCVAYG